MTTLNGACLNRVCGVKFAILQLPADFQIVAKAANASVCPRCGSKKISLDGSKKPVDFGLPKEGYLRFRQSCYPLDNTYQTAFAPNIDMIDGENTRWSEVYGLDESKSSLEMTIRYDKDEYDDDDILDIALPVRLFADGSVAIFEDEKRQTHLAYYTPSDMFKAHGLTF